MSDDHDAEDNGTTLAGGNGRQEVHHDINDNEEFVAHDVADQYHDEPNVQDADNNIDDDEEVQLGSVVRDPHLQDMLL
jgi:hypothetical protein